eukprot:6172579-Pleurochrysis_carterae.AAC.3
MEFVMNFLSGAEESSALEPSTPGLRIWRMGLQGSSTPGQKSLNSNLSDVRCQMSRQSPSETNYFLSKLLLDEDEGGRVQAVAPQLG